MSVNVQRRNTGIVGKMFPVVRCILVFVFGLVKIKPLKIPE